MIKYLRPVNYLNRALHIANSRILNHAESIFAPNVSESLSHPPIFFLGAPRSGSTLVVQVITDALDVGYLSNRHAQFSELLELPKKFFVQREYDQVVIIALIMEPLLDGTLLLRVEIGGTDSFDAPAYVQLDEVDEKKMCAFRRSVAALTNAFERPIIFKNLYASLRIQAIAHYLPKVYLLLYIAMK